MTTNRLRYILTSLFLCLAWYGQAQVSFTVQAPTSVAMGEQFRVSFTLKNATGTDFKAPAMSDFDVLFGPATARSSSTSIINGKTTSEAAITYTYTLMPKGTGSFRIGEASIRANDRNYTTRPVSIKVLPADKKAAAKGQGGSPSARVDANSLFVRAIINKTKVYEQEAVLVTYKLYTLHPNLQFEQVKFPEYEGFISQDVEDNAEKQYSLENYNGRNYQTAVLRQSLLFPQKSGRLTIPSGHFQVVVAVRREIADMDDFFNLQPYENVRRTLTTTPINIDVTPLPEPKPEGFDGAVGNYRISASFDGQQAKTNEALTLKVTIHGSGNIKLMGDPKVRFPDSFEQYDPKAESSLRVTTSGADGERTIEYYVVPRQTGRFTIPAFGITYFDPASRSYKTASTQDFTVQVAKGKGESASMSGGGPDGIKMLGQDINYLKIARTPATTGAASFAFSLLYWGIYLLLFLLAVLLLFLYRRRMKMIADEAGMRWRKANRVATKRLRQAAAYKQSGRGDLFYEEVLRAVWGYLGDKLGIAVSELNKNNVADRLMQMDGIAQPLVDEFLGVIETCEFARYAPDSNEHAAMDAVYERVCSIIEQIDNAKSPKR